MKDGWRALGKPDESKVYLKLQAASIKHIAPLECGGDLLGRFHTTITQLEAQKSWVCSPANLRIQEYFHHRLALGIVGRDLSEFMSTKELVKAIMDGMKAHQSAFDEGKVLHRDLSAGNFIIVEDGGILIDWDHCADAVPSGISTQPGRTGTWQFISCRLLQDSTLVQTPEDDRESAFWVLLYCALRFSASDLSPQGRSNLLAKFDESAPAETGHVGGVHKKDLLSKPFTFKFTSSPINDLLEELRAVFAAAYEPEPSEAAKQALLRLVAIDPTSVEDLQPYRWLVAAKQRADDKWLIGVLEKYLALPDWPRHDKATLQEHLSPDAILNPRKRTSEQAELGVNLDRVSKAGTAPAWLGV